MSLGEDKKIGAKASTHVGHGTGGKGHRSVAKTVRLTEAEFARVPAGICFSDYIRALMAAEQNTAVAASKCRKLTRVEFRHASDAEAKLCWKAIHAIKRLDTVATSLFSVSGNVSPQVAAAMADARDLLSDTLTTFLGRP
jgi:hypothetical protein